MRAPALFVSFGSPVAMRDDAYTQALSAIRDGAAIAPRHRRGHRELAHGAAPEGDCQPDARKRVRLRSLAVLAREALVPLPRVAGAGRGGGAPLADAGTPAVSLSLRCCVMAGRRKDDLCLPDELVALP
jgi:hypothetical protein